MKKLHKCTNKPLLRSLMVLGLAGFCLSCNSPAATSDSLNIPIYQDAFATGISDWSWTINDPASTAQVREGSYALYAELNAWEAVFLHFDSPRRIPDGATLNFSIYSETTTDIAIRTSGVTIGDGSQQLLSVTGGQWLEMSIGLSELGVSTELSGIWWQQFSSQPSGGVYLDNIVITVGGNDTPADPPLPDPDPANDQAVFASAESTSRFLSRATFGATAGDIDRLTGTSATDWFQDQMTQPASTYLSSTLAELQQPGATDPSGEPTFQGRTTPNFVFWQHAISAPDQLRQRMVFALSQILVISNSQNNLLFDRPTSVAAYQDILSRHALGNYRDLLEDVTYSTAMGEYLTYMQNRKGDDRGRMPDENYAREIMQLFTIGLVELAMNGQPRLRNGEPIETYSNRDVSGLARVFTGMSFALAGFEPGFVPISSAALSNPMVFFPEHHETGAKQFLGISIPAGTSGEDSITMALDALVAHPNTPPFIARQLIQRFVSSHPSPDYIERVATAFASGQFTLPDNSVVGTGRRGDLAATLAAILFDAEATVEPGSDSRSGKLREPVLRFTHWARAFDAQNLTVRHVPSLWNTGAASALSQSPFRSPSVFNFYRPGYVAPGTATGTAGLTMPELQIVNASSLPGFVNFMQRFVFAEGLNSGNTDTASSFLPDYSNEIALADSPDALVEHLNQILAAGELRLSTQERIADFIRTVSLSNAGQYGNNGHQLRVMYAVLMVLSSSEYIVQF